MALKDITVYLDESGESPARMVAAIKLAKQHNAHLTGLYVIYNYTPVMYGAYALEAAPELLETQRREARKLATDTEEMFHAAVQDAGLDATWRNIETDFTTGINFSARCTDLLMIGQPAAGILSNKAGLVDALVFALGRPVMVIPQSQTLETLPGQRILLAWDDSRESANAVGAAMPMLQSAEHVDVLSIDTGDDVGQPNAEDMAVYLRRHGIDSGVRTAQSRDTEVGDTILREAAAANSDLIVMGAYGHSRLREIILGGTTRHILGHTSIPVLMSH